MWCHYQCLSLRAIIKKIDTTQIKQKKKINKCQEFSSQCTSISRILKKKKPEATTTNTVLKLVAENLVSIFFCICFHCLFFLHVNSQLAWVFKVESFACTVTSNLWMNTIAQKFNLILLYCMTLMQNWKYVCTYTFA